ncbi:MAG: 2-succinyl-5-enolpyruvyl-6-hydroxy-3-cyclohexene-1-carboxylic-acid synthase [Marinoscillum sp.]
MMNQTVFDTSKILALKGVRHVVISPGSRNAPLTISFARNPDIKTYSIVDERSAGFIALGIAQKLKEPVALCCTSGTSLLNYAPAVAEAYYQQIPLIIISADRPSELIGQRDGQAIDQLGSLSNFVLKTQQLPANPSTPDQIWEYTRKLNEAVNIATTGTHGPVHINIPFREPFYPLEDQKLHFSENVHVVESYAGSLKMNYDELLSEWGQYNRKLIVVGQKAIDPELEDALERLLGHVTIVADVISNVKLYEAIRHHDLFLANAEEKLGQSLKPDLVITLGMSVISKSLKLFLRKYAPSAIWHFDNNLVYADTFKGISKLIAGEPSLFFNEVDVNQDIPEFNQQIIKNFVQNWSVEDSKTSRKLNETLDTTEYSEFKAFYMVLDMIPDHSDIHLANSMPVRFANFIQNIKPGCEVYANRGTSGIDGTNGTAVGNALATDRPTYLLTGDLSFFYDRNAFFHHHEINNLKIIVMNNNGGGIFRLIQGPSQLPELEQFFETRHKHTAKYTALEYGFDYHAVKSEETLTKAMMSINKDLKTPKLVEIFTNPEINAEVFHKVKNSLKN